MEKTPRYTATEKRLLLKLISNQKDIIEKKKTDAFTNRSKENAWKIITKSYNNFVKFKRTTKQLRQLYKNMKYAANVNSTSTANLSEMLEILEMQILNDPNIKSGEHGMVKSVAPMQRSPGYSQHNSISEQQQHYDHQSSTPQGHRDTQSLSIRDNSFFFNSIIKTEMLDDDEIDDEMIAQALSHQNDNGMARDDFGHYPTVTPTSNQPSSNQTQSSNQRHTTGNDVLDGGTNSNLNENFDYNDDLDDMDDELVDEEFQPPSLATTNTTPTTTTKFLENALLKSNHHKLIGGGGNSSTAPTKESLIIVAIEERRKKIELLETQIKYWKTLTHKIETCQKICCCKVESFHNKNQSNE